MNSSQLRSSSWMELRTHSVEDWNCQYVIEIERDSDGKFTSIGSRFAGRQFSGGKAPGGKTFDENSFDEDSSFMSSTGEQYAAGNGSGVNIMKVGVR